MNQVVIDFWNLCNEATEFGNREDDVPSLEPYLIKILNHVKKHPENEQEFIECFSVLSTLLQNYSHWIVPFCMRELQYLDVKKKLCSYFDSLSENKKARIMNYVSDVNWVYDSAPWVDAVFFKYYWTKEHPNEKWPCE